MTAILARLSALAIGPGDRKSVQPMAERLAPGDYDQLHHFVTAGIWDAAFMTSSPKGLITFTADEAAAGIEGRKNWSGGHTGLYKSATRPVRGAISVSMHPSVIERVFDLVGDPGNQLAVGGKLLYLNKAILRRATSRWHGGATNEGTYTRRAGAELAGTAKSALKIT